MKTLIVVLAITAAIPCSARLRKKEKEPTPLDRYIAEAESRSSTATPPTTSPGSLWSDNARLGDLSLDIRARRIDDLVTIIVSDRASAISKGTVKSARSSAAKAQVDSLAGPRKSGWLPNLASLSSDTKLSGEGETTRENLLTTTLTARVVSVMPNGNLIVEGTKNVGVNGEGQLVTIRGVVRQYDLSTTNAVASNQLGQLEVFVNGKGVVGDVVRRPNILYRLLLGVLPF